MLKAVICTICLLVLTGCVTTQAQTKIIDPEGKIWLITSKSDALVEIKRPDGTMVKVDNRGSVGLWELLVLRSIPETSFHLGDAKQED